MEESVYLMQEKQSLKQEVLARCFSLRFELACERNACEIIAFEVQNELFFETYSLKTK
jgi:hypothetical protein